MRISENFIAATPKTFNVPGNYFHLDSLPGGTVDVSFFRNGKRLAEELRGVVAGWWASPEGGFDALEVTSSLTQTVAFYAERGRVGSNVFSGNVSLTKPTNIASAADVALAAGVATTILAPSAARRIVLLSNLVANLNNIRVGDFNVGAARGVEVLPGQTVTLEGTSDIWGFSAGAQSVGLVLIND